MFLETNEGDSSSKEVAFLLFNQIDCEMLYLNYYENKLF